MNAKAFSRILFSRKAGRAYLHHQSGGKASNLGDSLTKCELIFYTKKVNFSPVPGFFSDVGCCDDHRKKLITPKTINLQCRRVAVLVSRQVLYVMEALRTASGPVRPRAVSILLQMRAGQASREKLIDTCRESCLTCRADSC